jgi:hypothetical protein
MSHRTTDHALGLIALLSLVGAGCAPDRPAAPAGPQSLSDAEAQLVGREVAGEMEDVAGSFTLGGLLLPSFPSAGIAASGDDRPGSTTNCPTITPFPPADADGDHVPDDVTFTFTLPNCSFSRDGATFEITGSIHITDPSTTDFGIRVAFDDLQHKLTRASGSFFLTRLNGARQVLRSASAFSLHDSTTTDLESSENSAAQLAKAWVVTFVADPGQTFDAMRRLPSGDLTVDGSLSRTRGTTSHTFAVKTVTPLHHDAACTTRPAFTSGELLVTKTGPDGTVTIHIVFNGCGVEPTVTVERTAA